MNTTEILKRITDMEAELAELRKMLAPATDDLFAVPEKSKSKARATEAELRNYAAEIDLLESDGSFIFEHWTANGWKNGSSPVKDWRAGMRKWKSGGYFPSQKAQTNGHRPKHKAYCAEDATRGKTLEEITIF